MVKQFDQTLGVAAAARGEHFDARAAYADERKLRRHKESVRKYKEKHEENEKDADHAVHSMVTRPECEIVERFLCAFAPLRELFFPLRSLSDSEGSPAKAQRRKGKALINRVATVRELE